MKVTLSEDKKEALKQAYYTLVLAKACDTQLLGAVVKHAGVVIDSKDVDDAVLDLLIHEMNVMTTFCKIKGA